jgi:hypothetical protein
MEALYECLEEENSEVKEFALIQIKEIIEHEPQYFTHNLETTLDTIIEHYNDERQIQQLEDELLETLANTQNSKDMLVILASYILKEEPPVLQALIRLTIIIIKKMSKYKWIFCYF